MRLIAILGLIGTAFTQVRFFSTWWDEYRSHNLRKNREKNRDRWTTTRQVRRKPRRLQRQPTGRAISGTGQAQRRKQRQLDLHASKMLRAMPAGVSVCLLSSCSRFAFSGFCPLLSGFEAGTDIRTRATRRRKLILSSPHHRRARKVKCNPVAGSDKVCILLFFGMRFTGCTLTRGCLQCQVPILQISPLPSLSRVRGRLSLTRNFPNQYTALHNEESRLHVSSLPATLR